MRSKGLSVEAVNGYGIPVDKGRIRTMHLGYTPAGAADQRSFYWANRLCGNSPDACTIELLFGHLTLLAQEECCMAITGATARITLDGEDVNGWQTLLINTGQRLQIHQIDKGMRMYIAVSGGFDVARFHGSVTAVKREGVGGLHQDGSAIREGDTLAIATDGEVPARRVGVPRECWELPGQHMQLRVVLGYQAEGFSRAQHRVLFNQAYRVSAQSDRMGMRLSGPAVKWSGAGIKSEGISFGAVQIPPDGQPIILLSDRQTIGGYPKIGSVLSLDCYHLAQAAPDTRVTFLAITAEDAHNLLWLEKCKREALILPEVAGWRK